MRIAALSLFHFRSWRRAEVAAPRAGPVAVFGPNGAGKTNLLEAVSLLSPGRGLRRAEPEALARRPEGPGWRVASVVEAPGGLHEVETAAEAGAPRRVLIDGKPAPQARLGEIVRTLWLTPAMDRLWIEGAAERRRFLDRLTLGFAPAHAEAAQGYEKAMRERNRLLKDEVRDARWFAALEARMGEAAAAMDAARRDCLGRLTAAQAGAETAFPAAALALAPGFEGPAEALPEVWAAGRARDLAAGRTLAGPHRADLLADYAEKAMPARDCSTGEQKALLVSLVLAAARGLAADLGAPPLLLLDEVAAHLDAGRRAALYAEIAALGAQAWMTGTGPELFEGLGPGALRLAVREEAGASHLAAA